MYARLLVGALSLACVSATNSLPARTQAGIDPGEHPEIVQVRCMQGSGTAFRISPTTLLSVAHVTSLSGCFINGKPFTVKHKNGDFSILSMDDKAPRWLAIDCNGFVAGRAYIALGFARGLPTLTEVDITATGRIEGEWSILQGVWTVIPGQSGGPIIDPTTGKVVGTINVFDARAGRSGSVALKSTAACNF